MIVGAIVGLLIGGVFSGLGLEVSGFGAAFVAALVM